MKNIDTLFIDLGDTFRVIRKDEAYQREAMTVIANCLGVKEDPEEFYHNVIEPRYDKYREWALHFYCEAPVDVLWTRWLAFDFPKERVLKHAAEMTYASRKTKGERVVTDGGIETVKELYKRGYTLAIVSDLVGTEEVDEWLDKDQLRPYFKSVQQSSVCLIRKPHPAIYYYAGRDRLRSCPHMLRGRQSQQGHRRRKGRGSGNDHRCALSRQETSGGHRGEQTGSVHRSFRKAAGHFPAA